MEVLLRWGWDRRDAQLVGLKVVSGLDDVRLVLVGNCLDVFGLEVKFGGMALDA